jgi:hypothetical protein
MSNTWKTKGNYKMKNQNNTEPDISWLKEDQKIKLDLKTMLVMILSPLSCILVWIWLLFLTSND